MCLLGKHGCEPLRAAGAAEGAGEQYPQGQTWSSAPVTGTGNRHGATLKPARVWGSEVRAGCQEPKGEGL